MTISQTEKLLPQVEIREVSAEELATEKAKQQRATVLRDEWYAKVVNLLDHETEAKDQADGLRKTIERQSPTVREMRANYESEVRTNQSACDVTGLSQQLRLHEDALALTASALGNLLDTLLGKYRLDVLEGELSLANAEASLATHEANVADMESQIALAAAFPGQRLGFVSERVESFKTLAAGAHRLAESAERDFQEARLVYEKSQAALLGRQFHALISR